MMKSFTRFIKPFAHPVPLIGWVLFALSISAYAPPPPQPWFEEHLSVQSGSLPDGVGIEVSEISSTAPPSVYLVITNRSLTPLYIFGKPEIDFPSYEKATTQMPSGTYPLLKIVSGKAYHWNIDYSSSSEGTPSASWEPVLMNQRSDAGWIHLFGDYLEVDYGTVLELETRSHFGSGRSENEPTPSPQTASLSLVYGNKIINIPFTVSYSTNQSYTTGYYGGNDLETFTSVAIPCSIIAIVIIILGLSILVINRRDKINPNRSS